MHAIYMPHDSGQVSVRGPKIQMIMGVHEAARKDIDASDVVAIYRSPKERSYDRAGGGRLATGLHLGS